MDNDTKLEEFEDFEDFDEITSSVSAQKKDTANSEVTENTAISENVTKEEQKESSNNNFEEFNWEERNLENTNTDLTEEEMFLNTKKMFSAPQEEKNFEEFDASSEFDTIQEENFQEDLDDEDFQENLKDGDLEETVLIDSEKKQEKESNELKTPETTSFANFEEELQKAITPEAEATSFANFEEELQKAITPEAEAISFANFEEELQKAIAPEADFSNFESKLQESQNIFAENQQEKANFSINDSCIESDFQETEHMDTVAENNSYNENNNTPADNAPSNNNSSESNNLENNLESNNSSEFDNFAPESNDLESNSENNLENNSSSEFDNFVPDSDNLENNLESNLESNSSSEFDNFSFDSESNNENNNAPTDNTQDNCNNLEQDNNVANSSEVQENINADKKTVANNSNIQENIESNKKTVANNSEVQKNFDADEKTVVQTLTTDEIQEKFENHKRILSEQSHEKPIIMEVNMEQNNIVRSFHWPGEKAVYYFYIWHCAEMDERKTEWTSGRFPYLAAEMPLPPKEKLDSSFSSKDWGMRRLEYKKNIPLYFYYAEPFQPSFFEPARLNYLRTLYFSYFPAYFSKVSIPNSEKATESFITPMLDPSKISVIPFLDESKDMQPCRDWLKEKIKLLQTKNALLPKANEQNVAGLVTLQEILRFYLRSYGFLLWALNYFCNYDNHARLGFSSTGNKIYSNCFPLGRDILDFLCVRNCLPMKRLENSKIGSYSIPYHQQETVPTFLGLGSFIGDSWTEDKEWKENDFIIFDNCPVESRQEKTAENFRHFHKLWKDVFFKEIDDLLAENKIHISVRRFSTNNALPLSLADENLGEKLEANKLYQNTISLKPADNPKKTKYLKNYLPAELATEFYNCFHRTEVHAERNNIFVPEKVEDWKLVAYLTYDGDLSASTLDKKTLVDFFQPDALPVENPREVLPRGILPFVLRP